MSRIVQGTLNEGVAVPDWPLPEGERATPLWTLGALGGRREEGPQKQRERVEAARQTIQPIRRE